MTCFLWLLRTSSSCPTIQSPLHPSSVTQPSKTWVWCRWTQSPYPHLKLFYKKSSSQPHLSPLSKYCSSFGILHALLEPQDSSSSEKTPQYKSRPCSCPFLHCICELWRTGLVGAPGHHTLMAGRSTATQETWEKLIALQAFCCLQVVRVWTSPIPLEESPAKLPTVL